MKNKITCITLILSIIAATTAYASVAGTDRLPQIDSTAVLSVEAGNVFTLEQAIEHALEHNKELKGIVGDIKKANIALKNARDAKRMLGKTKDFPMVRDYDITERAMNGYFVMQAEQVVELLGRQKEQTAEKLKYDIEKLFYDIQLTKKRAKCTEEGIQRLEKQLEVEKLKIELGMSMDFVLNMVNIQKLTLENQLNTLNYALDGYYALLRSKLDIAPSESINIAEQPLEYTEYTHKDSSEAYKLALEKRFDAFALKQRTDLLEFDFDLVSKYYTRGFKTYDNVKIDLAKAKNDYDAFQKGIEDSLKLLREDIEIKQLDYKNKKSALETGEFNFRIAWLKYNLGVISKLELQDERLKLMNLVTDEMSALQNYILAVKLYEISYGCGY